MKDYYNITHRFSLDKILKVEKFLVSNDLIGNARLDKEGFLAGLCSVKLPVEDNRNTLFINEIKSDGSEPLVRFDREYTAKELDNYPFLILIIKTAHLENPSPSQKYDHSQACPNCGAGVLPILPVHIPKNNMGKKLIDITAHNGWLILRKILKDLLVENKVTGLTFDNIKLGKDKENFYFGRINSILPHLDSSSKMDFNNSTCDTCRNSGNFHNFSTETSYVYKNVRELKDFNLTYEFFGEWKYCRLGGARHIVISQKVRQIFIQNKVKYLDFMPVEFINN